MVVENRLWAIINFQKEGMHFYRNAKGKEMFLKYPHRHIFKITVYIQQWHDDRDVEYIFAKRWLEKSIDISFNYKSCEMIGNDIIQKLKRKFGKNRKYKVIVMEDGENGALVEC